MDKPSKCVFCGSTSYGKNCPFSSFKDKIHLHTDDHTRCSFCGSKNLIGPGCPNSPTKRHKAGTNFFNGMAQESFILAYLMHKLVEPIYESQAYKLGLLNLDGNVIRKPVTVEEKMAFSTIDQYLLKLKRLLGTKIDILNNAQLLETVIQGSKTPIEFYKEEVELKAKLEIMAKRFYEEINEAHLPLATIQKLVLEAFSKPC